MWPKVIILVDADAFYASVEQRDNPQYRGKPVIVGGKPGQRGVVSACSYEARKYGVHSAMPISRAYRLCPHGIYVGTNMDKYRAVSSEMFDIYRKYTPLVEKVSVDEGYLDVTPAPGVQIAQAIREEVRDSLGITVTAGVSYCRYLAKILASQSKPDGLGVLAPEDAKGFLHSLPVSKLPGIGPKTANTLRREGINTVGQLGSMPPSWFETRFGKTAPRMMELAAGVDPTPVNPQQQVKSISEETTFREDQSETESLLAVLAQLSQDVGHRLRKQELCCRTAGIKVRYSDFTTLTRETSLPTPFSSDAEIFGCAKELFLSLAPFKRPVRLLGVSVKSLEIVKTVQPMLLQDTNRWESVSEVMDSLHLKHGKKMISLGRAIQRKP